MLRVVSRVPQSAYRWKQYLESRVSCGIRASQSLSTFAASLESREAMEYDVVIVGAGPAGLSAAIKLKQLCAASNGEIDLNICIVEKGSEVGAHILSGNVIETKALDELIPDWKEKKAPLNTPVTEDVFSILTEKKSYDLPNFILPPHLHNHGNYVISLSQLTRWMATQAEELGVEIYPGFAASEVLYDDSGYVTGVATRDVGTAKDGTLKDTFTRGIELKARQTLFAEGSRGSCSEELMKKFGLREGSQDQTYGIGLKEVWQVPPEQIRPGFVQHTLGWPLQHSLLDKTYGGSFLYHMGPDLVLIGLVVGLDYQNPYLNPYKEFQRFKHHPAILKHLIGGQCIEYGARALNEGGYHALPSRLAFPGGALIGCAAGTLNAVKIKGTHTAMKSGMLAAESVYEALSKGETLNSQTIDFDLRLAESWVISELKEVRNCRASFHSGILPGLLYNGLSTFFLKGREPWVLKGAGKRDSETTGPADAYSRPEYPRPDGVLSFDLLTNLQRSSVAHEHDQPSHLKIRPGFEQVPIQDSLATYSGPESRFCPAGVYEFEQPDDLKSAKLVINAQNCIHCKTCSIKTPKEYIDWTVPEGGGGPNYTQM